MPAQLELTLDQLASYFGDLAQKFAYVDFTPVWKTVGFYLASATAERFDKGIDPDGNLWAALLNPSRKRGGATAKPLRDTDILMASMTSRGSGHIERGSQAGLVWGTNIDYAGFHQWGTRFMVARPFLGVNEEDQEEIETILGDWATSKLRAA